MKAQIQKWGNSLAVRIPKPLAEEIGLAENTAVELSVSNGKVMIVPVRRYTLEAMVAGITDENRHPETDFGDPVGNEII